MILVLAEVVSAADVPAQPAKLAGDAVALFADRCVGCHGPNKRKGGLRLDAHASVLAGGASGPAVEVGKGTRSLMLQRVRGEGDEDRMPPEGPPLTEAQMQLLIRWIDAGAQWPQTTSTAVIPATSESAHWAYRAPVRVPAPAGKPSKPHGSDIDAYVSARLQQEGLTLSPLAPRETLLRRASLDLIGLPPTLAEIDTFVRDRRPDAWPRQLDRLLASPHFGERWARWWLDLARYADSNGYEKDRGRVAWKYRDWVIDAFNANLSFKQFTIEQIAGDMLPGATDSQRIATGFNRNTLINQEGGVDPEEAFFETLVDRVGTTSSVFLGTTLACAQCHNHKFDPLSQKDFYKFMAFFSNGEAALRGELFNDLHMGEPILSLATPEQAAARQRLEGELAAIDKEIAADTPEVRAAQTVWEDQQRTVDRSWQVLAIDKATSRGGATMSVLRDGSVLVAGKLPPGDVYEIAGRTSLSSITGIRLEVLGDKSLPKGGPGRGADGGFLLTRFEAQLLPNVAGPAVPLVFASAAADEQVSSAGPATLLGADPEGWAIDVEAVAANARRQAVFALAAPISGGGEKKFSLRLAHVARALRGIGRFLISVTSSDDPLFATHVPRKDRAALERPQDRRSPVEQSRLALLHAKKSSFFTKHRERQKAIRKQVGALGIATAMVLQERPGFDRPSAFVRMRGAFGSPAERVFADVPKALPPLPVDAPANRLGLARWLVDEGNPLTARVTVNRFWEQLFGRGLLETSEDFGTQSPPPSHPELLDWLATEFMRLGWSPKAMLRTIMMSTTYQQSSVVKVQHREKDPANHLLARGPRFRVEAETLRDSTLAVAGLLSPKLGGPSVFPWQPAGVWDVPYNDSYVWKTSEGQDALRRTLYTFLRRSAPYPYLVNFDATSRETCTLRRPRTNTPLQVLNTLNDPVFFKAAQALAARMQTEGGASPSQRIAYGLRLVTSRTPAAKEVKTLQNLFDLQRTRLAADGKATAQLLTDPTAPQPAADAKPPIVSTAAPEIDRAALTMVANVLLSLDEAITKE